MFKREHEPKIINGTKDVTRRFWTETRATNAMDWIRTGTWVKAKRLRFSKDYFARLLILDIRFEPPCQMDHDDCAREGYPNLTPQEFFEKVLAPISEIPPKDLANVWVTGIFQDKRLYRVEFKLMKGTVKAGDDYNFNHVKI